MMHLDFFFQNKVLAASGKQWKDTAQQNKLYIITTDWIFSLAQTNVGEVRIVRAFLQQTLGHLTEGEPEV